MLRRIKQKGNISVDSVMGAGVALMALLVVLSLKDAIDNTLNPLLDNEPNGAILKVLYNLIPLVLVMVIVMGLFRRKDEAPQY